MRNLGEMHLVVAETLKKIQEIRLGRRDIASTPWLLVADEAVFAVSFQASLASQGIAIEVVRNVVDAARSLSTTPMPRSSSI